MPTPVKAVVTGVKTGDTFTYSIKGEYIVGDADAVPPPGFDQYNATDYYRVTVTAVNGSVVSMDTVWKFQNGTQVDNSVTIDLATGAGGESNQGFYFLYAADLNQYDRLRPYSASDHLSVNATDTKPYANETRTRNIWTLENPFFDVTDPTYSRQCDDIVSAAFDRQTGMLDTLTHVQRFNSPQMNTIVTWRLVDTTAWQV
jgi:hypothetical protein